LLGHAAVLPRLTPPIVGHTSPVLTVTVESARVLRFADGSPVRAASAIAPLGDGWLVAQDDAAHAAWLRPTGVERLRVVPPVDGHDEFSEAAGTKHLKPDFEAACPVGEDVLLLGSGSTPARMRAALVSPDGTVVLADLPPVYERVAAVLGLPLDQLNLEGACRDGEVLRWFARGNLSAGVPSASVDVDLPGLLDALRTGGVPAVRDPVRYELGEVHGVGLTTTDAVALPDGRVLVSAAAEDTPNAVDDGPVVAAALALLDQRRVVAVAPLPEVEGRVAKVEGLALVELSDGGCRLLGVVDDDDPDRPSTELQLRVAF
jgi:hypothetical protein